MIDEDEAKVLEQACRQASQEPSDSMLNVLIRRLNTQSDISAQWKDLLDKQRELTEQFKNLAERAIRAGNAFSRFSDT